MEDEASLWRAADNLLTFLESTGRKNVRRPRGHHFGFPGIGRDWDL
jgi:hypothetical protein